MSKCVIKNGLVDFTGLTMKEAQSMKIALMNGFSIDPPSSKRQVKINPRLVKIIDMAQDTYCKKRLKLMIMTNNQ